MACVLGNPYGEFRGKLGGSVFSRNGHCAYVRAYAVPVNPNTTSQIYARNAFASAVASWSPLDASYKVLWNEYAKTLYLPRTGSHSNKYSGYQAWVASKIVALQGFNLYSNYYLKLDGADPTEDISFNNFNPSVLKPPGKSKLNNCKPYGETETDFTLVDATVDQYGDRSFTIKLSTGGITRSFTTFFDSNGNNNYFVLYMSNPRTTPGMFYKNELKTCLGYFRNWYTSEGAGHFLTFNELKYYSASPLNLANYNEWVSPGQFVRITLFCASLDGQMRRVGAKDVEVT